MQPFLIGLIVLLLMIVIGGVLYARSAEGFAGMSSADCDNDSYCRAQSTTVLALADTRSNGNSRRSYAQAIRDYTMADYETCLANFYTLGCRFSGYLGPFSQGYFSPELAVKSALRMGCRTFVYEIDYFKCKYPRLVVRNGTGIEQFIIQGDTDKGCNSDATSNIKAVSTALAQNAFASSDDPIIVVLYLMRVPPPPSGAVTEDYNKTLRTYYRNIAKNLAPLLPYSISTTLGGNYYRQKNESQLLKNSIENYRNKVLFFSNAETEILRNSTPPIPTEEDLDYIVNLRLTYNQTKFGVTAQVNPNGSKFGILDATDNYTNIPADMTGSTISSIKNGTWTMCLTNNPATIVTQATTDVLQKLGVHCIPIQIWTPEYDYMFTDKYFKKYSYIPKPPPLRMEMNKIIIPREAAPQADSKQGVLAPPRL